MRRCNIFVLVPVGIVVFVGIIFTMVALLPLIVAALGAEVLGCDERSDELFALVGRLAWWER